MVAVEKSGQFEGKIWLALLCTAPRAWQLILRSRCSAKADHRRLARAGRSNKKGWRVSRTCWSLPRQISEISQQQRQTSRPRHSAVFSCGSSQGPRCCFLSPARWPACTLRVALGQPPHIAFVFGFGPVASTHAGSVYFE